MRAGSPVATAGTGGTTPTAATIATAVLALAAAASGCIDFLEPGELEPRRGELQVELLVTDTAPGEAEAAAEVEGRFVRPRGADGTPVPVPDSTLRILGRTLPSEPDGADDDVLTYRADWRLTAGERDRDRMSVEGPVAGGDGNGGGGAGNGEGAGDRVRITFPLIARAGPDSAAPAPGEDLRLPLDPGSDDAWENVGSASWTLVVAEEGADVSLLIMSGSGRPPDALRVARELLERNRTGAPVEALFWTRMNARRSGGDLPYDLQLDATVAVGWRVVLE